LARLEDGDVELAVLAQHLDLEVRLHVFGSNAVLMDDGAGDALADLLFVAVLHRVAGDVVKDLALFERALGAWAS
jgi:hypothetical protein